MKKKTREVIKYMRLFRRLDEKISKTMIIAFSILIIGGLITYYQNKISKIEVPEKVTAVIADKVIKRGEVISGSHLREVRVYKPDKLSDGINDMSILIGKVALTTVMKGKEITENEITSRDEWFDENERIVGITFKHFTDIVGGKARPGDVVDVMVSYPLVEKKDGEMAVMEPEVIVEGIELEDVLNENNISYKDAKDKMSFKPYTVLVRITDKQEVKLDIAQKRGRLYLRRHGNYIRSDTEETKEESKVIITGR